MLLSTSDPITFADFSLYGEGEYRFISRYMLRLAKVLLTGDETEIKTKESSIGPCNRRANPRAGLDYLSWNPCFQQIRTVLAVFPSCIVLRYRSPGK